MPSIREDISKITAQVNKLNNEAKEAAQSTKSIGNNLKFKPDDIDLVKKRFASLRNELEINNKKLTEMEKASEELSKLKSSKAYKDDAEALQKINKLLDDYRVKIQYAKDKKEQLVAASKKEVENAEILKIKTEQINKQYEKTEETAQKLNRVALSLIAAMTKIVTSSVETGKQVYSMSKRFNSSAEDVQIWNRALELATGTQDIFNDGMKAMIQGMSQISAGRGIAYNNVLKAIGVNYSEIASLTPTEQFEAIINGLAGVENYSMRAGYAQQLFQEKGVLLAGALDGGTEAIERYKEQAKEYGIISGENAQRLVEIGFELEKAKSQLSVVGAELTIGIAPVLQIITTGLKVVQPIISALAKGLEKMGVVGGLIVTVSLTAMIIMPKIIMFSKQHRIARLLEAQAIEKVGEAQKKLTIGFGGWIGIALGALGIITTLIGAFSKAKDEADGLNDSLKDTVSESQGIVGGAVSDYTTTTEQIATRSTTYEMILNATIHGEGDTPISDENAVTVSQMVADEVNKGFGELIK